MKKALFACFALVLLIQCQAPKNETTPIVFTINQFDVLNNRMEVTFNITNPTQDVWEGGQWSLHWNQFSGSIQPESLLEGMELVPTKNSQYWILKFGSPFTLNPGASLEFSVIQTGIMSRLVMGPHGFFVHNTQNEELYDLNRTLVWKKAQGLEGLNIPSAAERYASYEGISTLPKEELHWVIPAPQKITLQGSNRPLAESLQINFGSFKLDDSFLTQRLQEGTQLKITANDTDEASVQIKQNNSVTKEGYRLQITPDQIEIEASSDSGVFYALESLHQIILTAEREGNGLPLFEIEDAPRFQHRGFMTDVARNFFPKEKIIQILDYMAFYKLNLLDLKLSDDEGWRIEIPDLPELTTIGSKRGFTSDHSDRLIPMYGSGSGKKQSTGSGFLTRNDFVEILKEAEKRHIKIVPQISFPSHARSAVIAMKNRYANFMEQGNETAANEYRLHDPEDQSEYTSAQLFKDNTICICDPSAYCFFEKVFNEIKEMYVEAELPMNTFNIGADELPYGVWRKSPLCEDYIKKEAAINSYQGLYDQSVKRLNQIITGGGAQMVGWEDVLLVHSEKSQSEIEVNQDLKEIDFIPYVWNNIWGGGREDMIYRLNNLGLKAVMSNSSAFYFDMTDDTDIENSGLSWSGFVNYKDSWGTEPLDVFSNKVNLRSRGIEETEVAKKVKLQPQAVSNFLGIQSQLWTETATNSYEFDRMLMPNMIVFSQRAWSAKEPWLEAQTAEAQEPLLNASWNTFVNSVGQRHLPLLSDLFGGVTFDLPKPGAIIENNELKARQQFPGLTIRYTLDGKEPTPQDPQFTEPVQISESSQVVLRVFNTSGRGGNSIHIN
ncbi:family 20 glycosylhydrolase [Flavobacteriaceae bacterium]|nr:family 20 glycosylhydrolase [Flavobacteriaceae bacterium]